MRLRTRPPLLTYLLTWLVLHLGFFLRGGISQDLLICQGLEFAGIPPGWMVIEFWCSKFSKLLGFKWFSSLQQVAIWLSLTYHVTFPWVFEINCFNDVESKIHRVFK